MQSSKSASSKFAFRASRSGYAAQIVAFVQKLRTFELKKLPSVSETIDWARALVLLHVTSLDADAVRDTLNVLLKYESDIESMKKHVNAILAAVN